MFLNFILPTTFILSWLIYVFKNDLHEIIYYLPILLLIPYFFLVSKIRSIRVMKKLSPFETPITHGYIERDLNPLFAIIAQIDKGSYKLYFNGNKKTRGSFQYKVFYPEIPNNPKTCLIIFNYN